MTLVSFYIGFKAFSIPLISKILISRSLFAYVLYTNTFSLSISNLPEGAILSRSVPPSSSGLCAFLYFASRFRSPFPLQQQQNLFFSRSHPMTLRLVRAPPLKRNTPQSSHPHTWPFFKQKTQSATTASIQYFFLTKQSIAKGNNYNNGSNKIHSPSKTNVRRNLFYYYP